MVPVIVAFFFILMILTAWVLQSTTTTARSPLSSPHSHQSLPNQGQLPLVRPASPAELAGHVERPAFSEASFKPTGGVATMVVSADHISDVDVEATAALSEVTLKEVGEPSETLANHITTPRTSPHDPQNSTADDMRVLKGVCEMLRATVAHILPIVGDLQGAIGYTTARIDNVKAANASDCDV
ncbi:hypothetical protein FA95DRAFT_1575819 [Auriscalpium vulgare]|uniref:Uncharacterized protein n=1 Tax=Auriscalpium vulgare TaxID=40419 RepID=A0ACB8RDQ3_9AGAM|nr:hypothetical protein FA95DRAFT_1575819 [Auriscalpium vulgare]